MKSFGMLTQLVERLHLLRLAAFCMPPPPLLINVYLTMSGAYEVIITKSIPPSLIVQDPSSVTHTAMQ